MRSHRPLLTTIIGGLTVLILLAALSTCFLFPDQRIDGPWSAARVSVSNAKVHQLANSDQILLSYGFDISQSAQLRNPRYVNKGTAWQRRITERGHTIAIGFETALLDPASGSIRFLPISNYVTEFLDTSDRLLLKSKWSHFSERMIYVVDATTGDARELIDEDPAATKLAFKTLDDSPNMALLKLYPAIKRRLEATYLQPPDSSNKHPAMPIPSSPSSTGQ